MASLTGTKIKDTYDSLLKVSDNGALDGTLQTITDGLGNNSALSLSTAGASVGGTLAVSGAATLSSTLGVTGVSTFTGNVNIGSAGSERLNIFGAGSQFINVKNTTSNADMFVGMSAGLGGGYIGTGGTDPMAFLSAGTERMRIYGGGDISFRDSSANEAFYWDASAASLGIGGASDSGYKLDVSGRIKAENTAYIADFVSTGSNASKLQIYADDSNVSLVQGGTATVPMTFFIGGSERMRIDSSGNITQSASDATLSVSSTNAGGISTLAIKGLGSGGSSVADVYIKAEPEGSGAASRATFWTREGSGARTEKMRITSNGTVLIGATDTSWTDTVGFYSFYQSATNITRDGAECMNLNRLTSDGSVLIFRKAGVSVGSVSVTGSATAYNTSSDYRLKEDWVAMEGALDRVDLLKPINFAWKADGSRVDGFLAHELAEVVPEAVTGEKDATEIRSVEVSPAVLDEEGNVITEAVYEDQEFPVYQGIDQSKIVPLLTAGLQEAHALIKELRAELNALKQA